MSRRRALAPFVAVTVLPGASSIGTKAAIGSVSPVLFATFRVNVAAVVLLTLVIVYGGYWLPQTCVDAFDILAGTALVLGANNVFLFLGQQHAATGAVAVIYSVMPTASPVFAALLFNDMRISAVDAAGILLGLINVVVTVDPKSIPGGEDVGQALIVCSTLSAAFGTVPLKRVGSSIGTLPQTAWAMATTAVSIRTAGLGLGESIAQVAWSSELVAVILYIGMLTTTTTYLVYFALLSETGLVHGNPTAYTVPVVATVTGWAFLGEAISPATVLGFGVTLSGFPLVRRESVARFIGLWGGVPVEAEQGRERTT